LNDAQYQGVGYAGLSTSVASSSIRTLYTALQARVPGHLRHVANAGSYFVSIAYGHEFLWSESMDVDDDSRIL
jgi:hypothetical protein